jgi:uncharacterized phage-associated protein
MGTTALDTAAAILEEFGPADPLKLQKLLYYAQAWSLAWRAKPMFEDTIEAWVYGPVVESVYQAYKKYGQEPIPQPERGDPNALSSDDLQTLRAVVDEYWRYAGTTLSDLTHSEPPWVTARQGLDPDDRGRRPIDRQVLRLHYRTRARFGHPSTARLPADPATLDAAIAGSGSALLDLVAETTGVRPVA